MPKVLKPKRSIWKKALYLTYFTSEKFTKFKDKFKLKGTRTHFISLSLVATFTVLVPLTASSNTLSSDPAWSRQSLDNGFSWYSTQATQRPNDSIEIRLIVNTGSLSETLEEKGLLFNLLDTSIRSQLAKYPQIRQFISDKHPLVTLGYDQFTLSLTLPNTVQTDGIKTVINFLSGVIKFDEKEIKIPLLEESMRSFMVTKPSNPQDTFWLNRIHESVLIGSEPLLEYKPFELAQLLSFNQQWFTPDVMRLYAAGKIDNRVLSEEINKTFGQLSGVRQKNPPMAVLQPLRGGAIIDSTAQLEQPIVSLYWDSQWQAINTAQALEKSWELELAREAVFARVNKLLGVESKENLKLNFECNVSFQRQLCGINLSYPEAELFNKYQQLLDQLVGLEEKGITDDEFSVLIASNNEALNNLFATYAKTDVTMLIENKIYSEQNGIKDISLEEYQQLRQAFLSKLTKEVVNQNIAKILGQEATILIRENEDKNHIDPAIYLEKYLSLLFPERNSEALQDN